MSLSRIGVFQALVSFILLILALHCANQLIRFTEFTKLQSIPIVLCVLVSMALTLSLPLFFWDREKVLHEPVSLFESGFWSWLQFLAYFGLSYFNYLVTFVFLRDAISFLDWFTEFGVFTYSSRESLVLLALPILCQLLGGLPILFGPVVRQIRISLRGLTANNESIRLVQLSDLHIGELFTNYRVRRTIEKVLALKPDIVVLTGDIFDGDLRLHQEAVDSLSSVRAKYGVFFVPGNHEYYWGIDRALETAKRVGFKVLTNSADLVSTPIGNLLIAGVTDPAANHYSMEPPNPVQAAQVGNDCNGAKILLSHQPSLAVQAEKVGFDLQLSGHTHAGQFFPWNLMIGFFQTYSKGLYQIRNLQLYVNQGTGFWGPPDRLGTICEITCIEIKGKS